MASFDFIDSAAGGYRFAWENRALIFRLAGFPVLIKTACLAVIFAMEWQENTLRQGLVFLPAYFMEGWMVVLCVRMALFGMQESLYPQQRALLGGTLAYILIQLALSLIEGLALGPLEQWAPKEPQDGQGASIVQLLLSLGILGVTLWSFRLLWLHIPIVMGVSVQQFLRHIRSYLSSLQMMGIWVMTLVPMGMVFIVVIQLLNAPFGNQGDSIPAVLIGLNFFLQSLFSVMIAVVGNLAMAYGIRRALQNPPDQRLF